MRYALRSNFSAKFDLISNTDGTFILRSSPAQSTVFKPKAQRWLTHLLQDFLLDTLAHLTKQSAVQVTMYMINNMNFDIASSAGRNSFVRQSAYSFESLNGTVCYGTVLRSSIEWVEYEYHTATQKAIRSEDEDPEEGLLTNQNKIKDTLVDKLDEWSSMRMQ